MLKEPVPEFERKGVKLIHCQISGCLKIKRLRRRYHCQGTIKNNLYIYCSSTLLHVLLIFLVLLSSFLEILFQTLES